MEQLNKNINYQSSKLFVYSGVDFKDEEEKKYERCYQYVQQQINGLSDKELHDLLSQLVCKDKHHEDVSIGLLYIILTDPQLAPKTYRDLTLITRDGLNFITNLLAILVADRYQKFSDVSRRQLLWLLRELIKNQVPNVENLVWNCIRHAAGGDISPKNILMVEGLLDIFVEFRPWLEKHHYLLGAVVYSYVRLIEDHNNSMLLQLRNKEVKFVIGLIRERFTEIIPLGRDFVRLLQNVAKIPEFEQLWRDILCNPKTLCPQFLGVWQLLQTRTSRRFLQCRLTPEVERKIHFLTANVKFGNQKRYQDWFQEKYFATPESHSLRSDLIRFIINVIHPSNDMLCSDIIPRWAIIGWLLTSCTNPVAQSNAKLALFYDWLFFDPIKDNIMNIEPGILVMWHSIRSHPLVSSTLLDFLCRIIKNFHPKNEDKIRIGVYNSLRKILEKQVIHSLHPLFESPKLDRELRSLIRENFREFCSHPNNTVAGQQTGNQLHDPPIDHRINVSTITPNSLSQLAHPHHLAGSATVLQSLTQISLHSHESPTPEEIKMQMHPNNFNPTGMCVDLQQRIDGNCGGLLDNNGIPNDDDFNNDNEPEVAFSEDEDEDEDDDLKTNIGNIENKPDDLTDDDDDLPLSKVRLKEKPTPEKIDLPSSIQESFDKLLLQKTSHSFEQFLNDYRTLTHAQALDQEQQNYVLTNITLILKETLPPSSSSLQIQPQPSTPLIKSETKSHQQINNKNNNNNNNNTTKLTLFPESKSDEKLLAESISYPIFYLFRQMYQYDNDKTKQKLRDLLTVLQKQLPSTGYLLLYFLKVYTKLQSRKNSSGSYPFKIQLYKQLCDSFNNNLNNNVLNSDNNISSNNNNSNNSNNSNKPLSLEKLLIKDLDLLELENTQIFLWLIPDIYREFKQYALNNSLILHIILRCIDAKNLRDLVYNITQGKLKLLKVDDAEGVLDIIRDSFQYETFEQFCLWQLIQAHDVPIETLQDILPELESSNNAEALTYMLFLLKNEKPSTELIRLLLSRETKSHRGDPFVTSALRFWCQKYEESLSEIIANLLTSKYPNSSPNKRKRPLKSQSALNSSPSSDQLLSHLEHFRRSCRHGNGTGTGLYVQEGMQRALQQAYAHSTDSIKKQYSDLFALAAEDETNVGRRGGAGRGRKQTNNKKDSNSVNSNSKKNAEPVNNYSSEESSNDEWSKPKQSKRRKKVVDSDDSD